MQTHTYTYSRQSVSVVWFYAVGMAVEENLN